MEKIGDPKPAEELALDITKIDSPPAPSKNENSKARKLEDEIKELEIKKQNLVEAIARFNANKLSAIKVMEDAEAKSREQTLVVTNLRKEKEDLEKQYKNLDLAIKEKFKVEEDRHNEIRGQVLADLEQAREKKERAEAMFANAVEEKRSMAVQIMALKARSETAAKQEVLIAELRAEEETLKASKAEHESLIEILEAKRIQMQKQEELLDVKIKEARIKTEAAESKEKDIQNRLEEVELLVEKYKVATSEINKKEEKLFAYEGEIARRESEAQKKELDAIALLKSAEQKELEVRSDIARMRKVIKDKEIKDFVAASESTEK